jgi:hypothetical protein
MPIISNTNLRPILDKLARFASESVGDPEFNAGFNAGMAKANADVISGSNSIAAYILALSDEDVEADLLPAARDLDENNPTPSDGFLLTIAGVSALTKALDTHFKRYGYKGLDDYLTQQNTATPTLRAHAHYKQYLKQISAKNSFVAIDTDIATFAETAAAAGTFGHLGGLDTTKNAGAKLVVKNVTGLTTSAVVTVTAKKLDGTIATLTATLSTHTIGHETDLSDTTQLYTDVTGISITTGTAGDQFKVVAKSDRDIAAA